MTVTMADPLHPVTPAPLAPVLRRMLPGGLGRAALCVAPGGRLDGPPQRRRMARTLLQEVAEQGGGQVFETLDGGLLLFGGTARATLRAAQLLGRLAGTPPPLPWLLPRDAAMLMTWAETAMLAPPAAPAGLAPATPGLAGLDARLEALAPEKLLRSRKLRRPTTEPEPATAGLRLRICRRGLAAELGTLAADPDLLRHAEDRLAARLLPALAAWAREFSGLWLLPLPRGGPQMPAGADPSAALPTGRPGLFGVLPFAALADASFAAGRQAMARRGWGLALEGPPPAALPLLDLGTLPAELLLLRWHPALTERAAMAALRRINPARLLLTAADGAEAVEFAARLGFAALSGPAVEPAG